MTPAGKLFTMLQTPHIDDKPTLLPHHIFSQAAFEQESLPHVGNEDVHATMQLCMHAQPEAVGPGDTPGTASGVAAWASFRDHSQD